MRPNESFVSQPVRSLQTMLRFIGNDRGQLLTVVPDGIYGKQTMDQVSIFQKERGLPVTGVADQTTWERIALEFEDALARVGPAEPLRIILDPGHVFRLGDESEYIRLMQAMLVSMALLFGSMSQPEVNGRYDRITMDAVSQFQALSGLPQTGEMDRITCKHLALQYPLAVNQKETDHRRRRENFE